MIQKYPDGIIERAKELYERGKKHKEIAEELSIQRINTIGEWVKRFGWKRVIDFGDTREQIVIWDEIAQNARTYLKGKGFTSMKDAISVYEHALKNIEALKKKVEKKDPKNDVFGVLGNIEDDSEDDEEDVIEDDSEDDEEDVIEDDSKDETKTEVELEENLEESTENHLSDYYED